MSDRTQIGPAVDSKLWERFRQDVAARKGSVRGNLGTELDKALREYLKDGATEHERRVEQRLSRIEDAVGVPSSDGGTLSEPPDTRTRAAGSCPDEKPAPNAPTTDKVDYLVARLIDEQAKEDGDPDSVAAQLNTVSDLITDAYDFGDRTASKYVDRIKDRLNLRPHPQHDHIMLAPDEYDRVVETLREQARDGVDE